MLERTRSTWERCFLRLPAAPAELALQLIGFDRDETLPDTWCEFCSAEVEPVNGRVPLYCSERHRLGRFLGANGRPLTLAA